MTDEPYLELAITYFALAFLSLLIFWALERISTLESAVRRLEREKAKETALAHLNGHKDYAADAAEAATPPATVLIFPENRRA